MTAQMADLLATACVPAPLLHLQAPSPSTSKKTLQKGSSMKKQCNSHPGVASRFVFVAYREL
jgi:hypothetical protein